MPQNTGKLYVVATPIGNLDDFSPRAVHCLKQVNLIAAEDTRHSRKLLDAWGITTPMMALHQHNEQNAAHRLLQKLEAGNDVALISDAGTPLISDPGHRTLRLLLDAQISISPIPGACAATAALSACGLQPQPHWFEGFTPAKPNDRAKRLEALRTTQASLVFYEAPHRIQAFLADAADILGPQRQACVAREISKKFEQFYRGTLLELKALFSDKQHCRGEVVVIIEGHSPAPINEANNIDSEILLKKLLQHLPVKTAAKLASEITNEPKNQLYQTALTIQSNN